MAVSVGTLPSLLPAPLTHYPTPVRHLVIQRAPRFIVLAVNCADPSDPNVHVSGPGPEPSVWYSRVPVYRVSCLAVSPVVSTRHDVITWPPTPCVGRRRRHTPSAHPGSHGEHMSYPSFWHAAAAPAISPAARPSSPRPSVITVSR